MKSLFDFQQTATSQVLDLYNSGTKTALLISLMGTGKTVMAASLINEVVKKGKRSLFLCDLTCLIPQIADELITWKLPFSIAQANYKYDSTLPIAIASAQTIDAKISRGANFDDYLGNFDFIVFDEAHNLSYRKIAIDLRNHYLEKGAFVLGMTATPWRLNSQEYLGQWYSKTVITLQPPELIKMQRSVPARIFGFQEYFDLSTIATGADGDYLDADMEKQAMSEPQLRKVYTEWETLTPNQSTIAFCSTVNHAVALSDYFNGQGISSAYITGETSHGDRQELFKRLESGELKLLCSINTLTAGFNCKRVSCVLYVRVTKSKAAYHQATGRAARVYPDKEFFYILDFGANYKRLGSPMSYQDYDITENSRWRKERTKICPECGDRVSVFARLCPNCGHKFEAQNDEYDHPDYDDPVLDLDLHMVEHFCSEDRLRLAQFRNLKKQAYIDGSSPDTAANKFKAEHGYFPPIDWHYQAVLGVSPAPDAIAAFHKYLSAFAPHDFWLQSQLRRELGENTMGKSRKAKKKASEKQEKKQRAWKFTSTVHWWDILGCSRYATFEEAKLAYREQCKKWHPDVCKDAIATKKMQEINNAYDEFTRLNGIAN